MATEVELGAGDAWEPSENWDDDFEFDPSSSSATPASSSPKTPRKQGAGSGRGRAMNSNAHAHYTRKMSIASSAGLSMVEDWDTDSVMGGGGGDSVGVAISSVDAELEHDNWDLGARTSTPGAGGSGSGAGTPKTPRTPRTPRTPVGKAENKPAPRVQHVEEEETENWDDDFEDGSPRKPGLTTSRLQPSSLLSASASRRRKASEEGEKEESWDDEYEDSADEDGGNEFGFHDKEEDKTVTAKSRRAALASSSSTRSPPLPPPPLPPPLPMSSSMTTSRMGGGPFHMPTSQSYFDNPQPFPAPRSPTSSVFSVPNTVYSQSNSHNSNGSTSHLRPSSAFALLPPSPEIHHMRQRGRGRTEAFASAKMGAGDSKDGKERRRLRKKSRPLPEGTFELKDVVPSALSRPSRERERYSFSDAEGELNIHAAYPSAHGRDTPASGISASAAASMSDLSSGHGHVHAQGRPHARRSDGLPRPPELDGSVPQTPRKQSTGPGSTLLSRIGSVKRWGVRRRSRGVSAAPENRQDLPSAITDQPQPSSQPTSPDDVHQDSGRNSRPPSSRSSNALSHAHRNSVNINPSTSGSPSSNNWFFRGGSGSKHASGDDRHTHGSPPVAIHRRGSVGATSSRSRSQSRAGSRAGNARDAAGKTASPLTSSSPNLINGKSPSSIVTASSTAGGKSRKSMDFGGDVRFPADDGNVDEGSPSPYNRPMSTTATPEVYATPSKLAKRKSLGFMQLRRGLSTSRSQVSGYTSPDGKGKKKEDDSDYEGVVESTGGRYGVLGLGRVARPGSRATGGEGEDSEERPRRKSFSRLLIDRADKDKHKEKDKDASGTMSVPMTPTKADTPSSKDGTRGFMGSVRRISLVGRHRRMKSGGVPVTNASPPSSARSSSVSRPPLPNSSQGHHQRYPGNLPYTLPPLPGTGSNISLRLPSGSNVDLPSMMRLVSINSSASGRSGEESLRPASTVSISASSRQVSAASMGEGMSDGDESLPRRYGDLRTARPRRRSRSGSRSVSRTDEKGRSNEEVTRRVSSATHMKRTSIIGVDFSPPLKSSSSFGSSSEDIPPLPTSASRVSQDIQRPVTPPYSKPSSPRTPSSSTFPATSPSLPKTPTSNMKTPTPKNMKIPKSPKTPSRVPPLPTPGTDQPALPLLPPIELQPPSPPQTVKASSKTHGKGKKSLDAAFESLRFELNADHEKDGRPSFGSLGVDDGDATKGEGVSPATSTSSVFYTPKSSPKPGASPQKQRTTKPVTPVAASLSPGRGVGLGQSASLGRTSGIDVSPSSRAGGQGGGSGTVEKEKEKEKGGNGWKRRNSLGDLKIPARISQAQVGLRRDLGMVREFAGSVEQLKDLQSTYYTLISEVQGVLDSYAQLHAQQAQEAARSSSPHSDPRKSPTTPPSPAPRSTSPSFLSSLNLRKGRSRSNTVGSTTSIAGALSPTSESNNGLPAVQSAPDVPFPADEKKQAYKDLAAAFYSLNSRYKITLECAELLIDLGGGGSGGTASGGPSTSASAQAQVSSPTPSQLQTQHTEAQQQENGDPTLVTKRSRERAITLAGDENKPPLLVQAPLPLSTSVPSTSPLNTYNPSTTSPSPPLQTTDGSGHTHNSWRASTGRHDLSQRQLVLLREMLNNSNAATSVADEALGVVDKSTPIQSPSYSASTPAPLLPISPASAYTDSAPLTAPLPSSAHAPYGEGQMIVNWDWRWGDPRNSTITLPSPSEEAALHSKFAEIVAKDKEREKKRRSTRLGMSGIRDMLRALKRSADAQSTTTATSPVGGNSLPPPPMPVHYHSTTSLSTESSASAGRTQAAASSTKNGRSSSRARYPLPIPRMPSLSHTHSSGNSNPSGTTGRRRAKTSTGPESMRGGEDVGWSVGATGTPFPPKSSPRRPSLASIFRIGKSSEKTQQVPQPQPTMSPEPMHSASTYASTTGASQDNHSSSGHQQPSAEPYAPGELDGDLSNTSFDAETSDWDRMDSASDLDAAARALSVGRGGPNKLSKFKHVKKGRSPYLVMRGRDEKKGSASGHGSGKEGVSSSSSVFVGGQSQGDFAPRMASHSQTGLVTKRSFCASQSSLLEAGGGSGGVGVPQRTTRLSGVEEMRDHEHEQTQVQGVVADVEAPISASSTRSNTAKRLSSGSRPSSSRSTRSPIHASCTQAQLPVNQTQKTGSVRSMPPHLTASATMPPLGTSSSHQRPVSGPYPASSCAHPYATTTGHGRHGHHHHHHHAAHAAAAHGGDVNIRLAMTPENIKPLLENAREVLVRLVECIDEVKALSGRCKELVDENAAQKGVVVEEAVVS
ncbi:hypothetical protein CVT24_005533 [Panaeolus cyanescens]|uniref:Uncharacterized protein n=1 Tax=Panaeolus cyanescens TaxID=181874 RepID=A0A409VQG0_9AGAR|nr:hypothetical protein CVT24_005533 [Panaeolus cyanescens]